MTLKSELGTSRVEILIWAQLYWEQTYWHTGSCQSVRVDCARCDEDLATLRVDNTSLKLGHSAVSPSHIGNFSTTNEC